MNSPTGSSSSAAAAETFAQSGSTLRGDATYNALRPPTRMTAFVAGLAILFASGFGYAIYSYGSSITGPFIFGDEFEYFLFGHDLFAGTDLSSHAQYGILYPSVVATFFHFGDVASVYHWMRAFNVVVLTSSVIPVFLFTRALFLHERALWLLFSVFAATTSFSAYTDLIWAEPLYFMLFQWLVLSLFAFYQRPQIATGCMTGVLLALLFHTKPGAGLVLEAATLISLVALFGAEAMRPRGRTVFGAMLAMIFVSGALMAPWIVRNLSLGAGPIGYQSIWEELKRLSAETGGFEIAKRTFASALYQLSYLFIATWGLLGALAVAPFFLRKVLPTNVRALAIFLAASVAGLIALVSLGSNGDKGGQEYWMPFGRYLSVVCPTIVILALYLLTLNPSVERREKRYLIAVTVILAVVTTWATPLLAIVPRSIVNASDLALAMAFVDKGLVIWRQAYEPTFFGRVGFAALFTCLGLMGILATKRRDAFYGFVVFVLVASVTVSLAEHHYMRALGTLQSPMNDAIRFLHEQGTDFEHAVGIDRDLEKSSIGFIADFWNTSRVPLRFVAANEFEQRIHDLDLKYFISPKIIARPIAFAAPGIYVYLLKD